MIMYVLLLKSNGKDMNLNPSQRIQVSLPLSPLYTYTDTVCVTVCVWARAHARCPMVYVV